MPIGLAAPRGGPVGIHDDECAVSASATFARCWWAVRRAPGFPRHCPVMPPNICWEEVCETHIWPGAHGSARYVQNGSHCPMDPLQTGQAVEPPVPALACHGRAKVCRACDNTVSTIRAQELLQGCKVKFRVHSIHMEPCSMYMTV